MEIIITWIKDILSYVQKIKWKKVGIHLLTHNEIYQLIVLGSLAINWFVYSEKSWPEPLLAIFTVFFAGIALRKVFIKGNLDEELEKLISRSHPVNDWYINEQFTESEHIAVYRKQPAIKITLSHEPLNDNFREEWLNTLYPDPHASSHQVSIQYNGNELFNKTILLVDGGRIFLPLPKSAINLETTEFDLAICQILNGKTGYDTSYYFKQSKMIIDKDTLEI